MPLFPPEDCPPCGVVSSPTSDVKKLPLEEPPPLPPEFPFAPPFELLPFELLPPEKLWSEPFPPELPSFPKEGPLPGLPTGCPFAVL